MTIAPNLIIGLPVLDATETFRSLLDATVAITEQQDTAHSAGFMGALILAERLVIGLPALDAAETLSTTLDVRLVASEQPDIPDFTAGILGFISCRIAVVERPDVFAAMAEPGGDVLKASENADVAATEGEVLNQPLRPQPLRTDALKDLSKFCIGCLRTSCAQPRLRRSAMDHS